MGDNSAPGIYYDGTLIPGFDPILKNVELHLTGIKDMNSRDSDILLCTYPKSGTNWVWEILSMLMRGTADYSFQTSGDFMLELKDRHVIEEEESPRILDTHLPFRFLPEKHITKGYKIIHPIRNPKDALVSFYCHSQRDKRTQSGSFPGSWAEYLKNNMEDKNLYYDGWFAYERDWEQAISSGKCQNVYTFYFENLKKNPVHEIKLLSDYLEIERSDEFIQSVADKCSFKNLSHAANHIKDMARLGKESTDGKNFQFRKGEVGDWKNWFTVAQNEAFHDKIEKEMKNSSIQPIYEI